MAVDVCGDAVRGAAKHLLDHLDVCPDAIRAEAVCVALWDATRQSLGIERRSPTVRSVSGKASEPARTHHSITS